MALDTAFRPFGQNKSQTVSTSSTAASITFSGMTHGIDASYRLCNWGAATVFFEMSQAEAQRVGASQTTSIPIPAGTSIVVTGPANSSFSLVSASASSVTITPGEGKL